MNAKALKGDVRRVIPRLKKRFDRVLMPLPMTAEDFLDTALNAVKKNGILHLYQFITMDEKKEMYKKIKEKCKENGRKCRILRTVKCGQFSPKRFRVCVDMKIL
jgi:tRNA (guanine37-N1)-methyltransferase